jgi:hypothetical protein
MMLDVAALILSPVVWLLVWYGYRRQAHLSIAAWILLSVATVGAVTAMAVTVTLLLGNLDGRTEVAMRVARGIGGVLLLLPFGASLLPESWRTITSRRTNGGQSSGNGHRAS